MTSTIFLGKHRVTRVAIYAITWCAAFIATSDPTRSARADEGQMLYGELDAGTQLFRFIIEVPKDTPSDTATLISLDEGNRTFKLDPFQLDDQSLIFELKETGVAFAGKRKSISDTSIHGTWKQRGATLEVSFKTVSTRPIDSPIEIWRGTMKAGFQALEIQVRSYEGKNGDKFHFLDSISQNVGGFKTTIKIDGDAVEMKIPALKATYTGRYVDGQSKIEGTWKQVQPLKLDLVKVDTLVDARVVKPNRPQTPQPPFLYESREITFQSDAPKSAINGLSFGFAGTKKNELFGTLTIPKKDATSQGAKFPLAILISGSGPQDRDETILEHKPFWVIADYLSRRGVAVLRYDERGVGKSQGNFASATTADFAEDVKSAIVFAKTLDDIDHSKIGLIGHSEGGLVAPMVAADDPTVAWVILMAGPGVNGEQILYSQGALIIDAEGGTDHDKKKQRRMQELAFQAIQRSEARGRIEPLVSPLVDQLLTELPASELEDAAAIKTARQSMEKQVRASLVALKNPWFQYFAKHEPGTVLEKVRCPVLAINGSKDVQVDPKLNLPKIEEHLKKGGNMAVTIREFEGLNHMFQTCRTGGLSGYATIEETIAPAVLLQLGDWILSVGPAPRN